MLRALLDTKNVIYENDIFEVTKCFKFLATILEANHQLTLFMIFRRITIDNLPIAKGLYIESLPLLFLIGMVLLQTFATPTMDLSHLVFLDYLGTYPYHLVKQKSTPSSLFSISSTS